MTRLSPPKREFLLMSNSSSPFLLDKEKGHYWGEIKECLNNASEQKEYIRLLDFENRDLQIRERKHSCYEVFRGVLLRNPYLEERAAYSPEEAFCYFLNERRDALDISNPGSSPAEMDRLEILFLGQIEQDLIRRGDESLYIKQLLLNGDWDSSRRRGALFRE